jgi:cysteinyl-tRNA synthetase
MDYGEETMAHAVTTGKLFSEFFHNVKAILRKFGSISGSTQFVGPSEEAMLVKLESAKFGVRTALLDDFDTPKAIAVMIDLVKETNKYMELNAMSMSTVVLTSVAKYITFILHVFGLIPDAADIGFPLDSGDGLINASSDSSGGVGGKSREDVMAPLLDVLANFRAAVRLAALSGDTSSILRLNDQLRDDVLPDLGVRMEDKGSGANTTTVWKLDNPETLRRERKQKEEAREAKELEKQQAAKLQAERAARAMIPPADLFRGQTDLYSQFDESGMPTHDAKGEPLSKSSVKKLQKEFEKQVADHQKYLVKAQTSLQG